MKRAIDAVRGGATILGTEKKILGATGQRPSFIGNNQDHRLRGVSLMNSSVGNLDALVEVKRPLTKGERTALRVAFGNQDHAVSFGYLK